MQGEKEERYNKQQTSKKALVIAVSQYNSSSLKPIKFCENDGQEMYKILKKLGYEIPDNCKLIGNVESQRLKKAIYNFFTNQDNNPDDTLVFYYSGHGVPDKWGATFLAPSDMDSNHPFMTGFSFVLTSKSQLGAKLIAIFKYTHIHKSSCLRFTSTVFSSQQLYHHNNINAGWQKQPNHSNVYAIVRILFLLIL